MRVWLIALTCTLLAACQDSAIIIDSDCPETGACTLALPSGESVTLNLKGELIAMQPLTLKVSSSSPIYQSRVVFTGVDMNMGILPYDLTQTDFGAEGIGRVASCTEPSMTWQAQYQFVINGQEYKINRQFVVEQ
ncbi:hypothetical protein [Salinibius halmophilus]|uniref:hypothetical protein n=1 Tax=Salinibius halmophilus TaxID=1853216 RepID=UPI000E66F9FC|nr:hypothetical protein [Salinibius halmophilus]